MSVAAPEPVGNQGQPVPRIDARLKVTGAARYAADTPLANLAHAVLVTTDVARGEVKSVDLTDARASRGVLAVLSYGDVDELQPPRYDSGSYTSLAPLQTHRIWHDGQIMALVVAETSQAAEAAAAKIKAAYVIEPASAELDSPGTETIAAVGAVQNLKEDPRHGDFTGAFQNAAVTLEAEYRTPTQTHNAIELFSTTAAWSDEKLTIYEPSQNVYGFRAEVAHQLNMDVGNVRVVALFVGGGFGSKGPVTPRTAIVALAAKRLGRPVRCVVSRSQGFTTQTYRAPTRHRIRLGANHDGRILAFGHESWELTSRKDNYAVAGTETTTRMYGYGAVYSKVNLVKADRQTPAFMRSPPELPYMFALESALDELAYKLRIDPIELRRINDTQTDPIEGKPFSSRELMRCFDEAARAFSWGRRESAPRSMREGDWMIGLGCATAVYPTNVGTATARVRLSANGKVLVQSASHEIGTGVRTVAGQMAAEQLGVAFDAVTVETGDSDLPPAPVAGGSNSTASVCSAVLKACAGIRGRLIRTAISLRGGPLFGRPADSLTLKDGAVIALDGRAQQFKELFDALGSGMLEEYAEFVPEGAKPESVQQLYGGKSTLVRGTQRSQVTFAFGAEFVEVRVNVRTSEIRVPRLVGAFAAGRIMNTRTARSQLMGGLVWGMSAALLESTEFDPNFGRTVNRDLQDYLVPVNADVENVEVIMLPEVDKFANPAGVKGIGELGNVGTNAAVANAIFHATGKRIRSLPIRLEQLMDD